MRDGCSCTQVSRWDAADVPVGEHFADQLVLLLAMSGGGALRTLRPSLHTRTQLELVPRFLPVRLELEEEPGDRATIRVHAVHLEHDRLAAEKTKKGYVERTS